MKRRCKIIKLSIGEFEDLEGLQSFLRNNNDIAYKILHKQVKAILNSTPTFRQLGSTAGISYARLHMIKNTPRFEEYIKEWKIKQIEILFTI